MKWFGRIARTSLMGLLAAGAGACGNSAQQQATSNCTSHLRQGHRPAEGAGVRQKWKRPRRHMDGDGRDQAAAVAR